MKRENYDQYHRNTKDYKRPHKKLHAIKWAAYKK